jgi:transcriptional repressor NrdR
MKCPFCGHLGDKVVDSRESKEGEVIRRRRECLDCGRRFTSYERIDEIPYMVIKKDGTRERFERQKLIAGLLAPGPSKRWRTRWKRPFRIVPRRK